MSVVIDTHTGDTGSHADWVAKFDHLWRNGRASVDGFMSLLSDDVRLIAPGLRSTTGRDAGRVAFEKTFKVFPDLVAEVTRWAANADALFIEMKFSASVGGKPLSWSHVDRFLFRDGQAVERVAFFDNAKLQRAFLRGPAGWSHLFRRLRSGL